MAAYEKRARSSPPGSCCRIIPEDLVIDEILTRLPVKSLLRFKSVCKLWCSSIADPYFVDSHYNHSLHNRPLLLITFPCNTLPVIDYRYPRHTLCVDPEGAYVNLFDFILIEKVLSCYGGLILYNARDGSRVVCNPITKQSMALPYLSCDFVDPPPRQKLKSYFDIGYDRSNQQHKVLHICQLVQTPPEDDYRLYNLYCDIITLGEAGEGWRRLDQLPPDLLEHMWRAYANGAVHWRNTKQPLADDPPEEESLVAFDFTQEKFHTIPLPHFIFSNKTRRRGRILQVMEGYIGLVDADQLQDNKTLDLWILQDYTKRIWIRQTFCLSLDMLQDLCLPIGAFVTKQVIMQPRTDDNHLFWLYYYDFLNKKSSKVELLSQVFCPGNRSGAQVIVDQFAESLYGWNEGGITKSSNTISQVLH